MTRGPEYSRGQRVRQKREFTLSEAAREALEKLAGRGVASQLVDDLLVWVFQDSAAWLAFQEWRRRR